MKRFIQLGIFIWVSFCSDLVFAKKSPLAIDPVDQQAQQILAQMSVKEKIGQKLMLDFRYWCSAKLQENKPCTQDFVKMNSVVQNIISQNHIGGVILFSNNLKDIPQIIELTDGLQQTMKATNQLALLIGTDQEGGIVARLPRDTTVTFPGNMGIAAAYLGQPEEPYSSKIGKIIARNLKAVGINIDFAPAVDVNVNPLNPIISVRSFSDDPKLVAKLGLDLSRAMQEEGVAATLKHFPGHGDTVTDSHVGLPVVNHTLEQAWQIDLYPFQHIIAENSPDLIMTAHIQFPALDDSRIYAAKSEKEITTPATLSRKIQTNLLRDELGYQGVVITDALDMGAIALNFDSTDATIKALAAGDDIALMPIALSKPEDAEKLAHLINQIEAAIADGRMSMQEFDQSVLRIIKLKMKLGLFEYESLSLAQKISRAQEIISDKSQRDLEDAVTNDAITLVQNNEKLLPINLSTPTRIHILTPWLEQGAGIAEEIKRLQIESQLSPELQVDFRKMADTDFEKEKLAIDQADIVIVGNITVKSLPISNLKRLNLATEFFQSESGSLVFPDIPQGDSAASANKSNFLFNGRNEMSESQFAFQALAYAKAKGKKTIFISLLAPYDLPNYKDVSDVMLAAYNFYGYLIDGEHGYYRGPSMPALTRIIFGQAAAKGKLPLNIPNPVKPIGIVYERGEGLELDNSAVLPKAR